MQLESRKLLSDMRDAADAIIGFTAGKTSAEMQVRWFRSSVYFEFVVIGEALSQLKIRESDVADQITESWRIIGFRNQIVHGYFKLDHEITWRIIHEKLPLLRTELAAILGEA